ncbi:MAG TPA: hypothetical protein VFI60_05700 [Candidatus Acidoferrum sp.]|nr:hypothetical protein [Candidatus Acidoferrum sp.]
MSPVKIRINPTLNMETLEWVSNDGEYWAEPAILMCGASGAEKAAQQQQATFSQMLFDNYANYFGKQSDILSSIKDAMSPILAAGPNQTGFSAAEKAALNTEAIDTNAAASQRAGQAVSSELAGRGNNSGLTSGVDKQIQAGIASKSAQALATQQNEITQADYATGRENFGAAENALERAAGEYNPNAVAEGFNNSNQNAFGMASTINQQNNALGEDILGLGIASLGAAGDYFGAHGAHH